MTYTFKLARRLALSRRLALILGFLRKYRGPVTVGARKHVSTLVRFVAALLLTTLATLQKIRIPPLMQYGILFISSTLGLAVIALQALPIQVEMKLTPLRTPNRRRSTVPGYESRRLSDRQVLTEFYPARQVALQFVFVGITKVVAS